MTLGEFLYIHPSELKFPYELKKQTSCSMLLTNKSDRYIAFKVKTTNPKKYCVRPNAGIVLPRTSCNVTVTMQASKEAPADMQCKDKFLVQSVIAPNGFTSEDVNSEMFKKENGRFVNELKLRVVYIPANPPSPVPEESEETSSPSASMVEDGGKNASLLDAVTRPFETAPEKHSSSEVYHLISKLTEEKASAIQQNQRLLQELAMLRKESGSRGGGGSILLFAMLIAMLGFLVGYLIKKT